VLESIDCGLLCIVLSGSVGIHWLWFAVHCVVRKCWNPGLSVCDELYRRHAVPPAQHQITHVLTNNAVLRGSHCVSQTDTVSECDCIVITVNVLLPLCLYNSELNLCYVMLAGWLANGIAHVNEVALRHVWLVLGWVSIADIPSCYLTSHPGLLSLAIPPWIGTVSTGDGLGHC